MSCIPCGAGCEGASIPVEDFDRWTDSLNHVLGNKDAIRRFQEFLHSRDLTESAVTLEFWERCEVLSRKHLSHRNRPGSHKPYEYHYDIEQFKSDTQDLVTFAEDNVNLNLEALQEMYNAVELGEEDQIKSMLRKAMQSAVELLQDHYQLFRGHLLQQRGLGNS